MTGAEVIRAGRRRACSIERVYGRRYRPPEVPARGLLEDAMISAVYVFAMRIVVSVYAILQAYAPTNIAIRWTRRRENLKWALPIGLALTAGYWFAASFVLRIDDGGVSWLTFLALLLFFNGIKFAVAGLMAPFQILQCRTVERRAKVSAGSSGVVLPPHGVARG